MRTKFRRFFAFAPIALLVACGGESSTHYQHPSIQPAPKKLEFVAGYIGGEGNVDGYHARFSRPSGIAVNDAGVVFVKDAHGGSLRRIGSDGLVSSVAGSGNKVWSKPANPFITVSTSLTFDSLGNLYAADSDSCVLYRLSPDGRYTLYAGGSDCGYQDGMASQARFGHIRDMASDHYGNLYLVDNDNSVVRKIDRDGMVTTFAGKAHVQGHVDGPRTEALFVAPESIAVRSDGTVYVTDSEWEGREGVLVRRFRAISPDGLIRTISYVLDGPFVAPRVIGAMVFDKSGNLFFLSESRIMKMTPEGRVSVFVNGQQCCERQGTTSILIQPVPLIGAGEGFDPDTRGKLAIDKEGNLYFGDWVDSIVRKIRPDGQVSVLAGKHDQDNNVARAGVGAKARFKNSNTLNDRLWGRCAPLERIFRLSLDAQENVIVSTGECDDWRASNLNDYYSVDKKGEMFLSDAMDRAYSINGVPTHVGKDGTRYYVYADSVKVQKKRDPSGEGDEPLLHLAGSTSWTNTSGQFQPVDGIGEEAVFFRISDSTIDQFGNVYVIERDYEDYIFRRIDRKRGALVRKITPAGEVKTIAGFMEESGHFDGNGSSVRFHAPSSIVADKLGNLFITDTYNHVIRKIDASGNVSTFAGTPQKSGWQNGQGNQASFNSPDRIILDHEGNLLVADSGNCLLRKITPNAKVSTLLGQPGMCGVVLGDSPSLSSVAGMVLDSKNVLYLFGEWALLKVQL